MKETSSKNAYHSIKSILVGIVLQILSFSSIGFSASKDPFNCTKNINEWGRPSKCSCEEGYEYKAVLGYCIEEGTWDPKDVIYEGILRVDIRGPGGETTGIGIEMDHRLTDLILKKAVRKEIKKYPNQMIRVEGQEIVLPSTEPHGPRGWVAIVVDTIEVIP